MSMKVLVLGGYGNFGARICKALAGNPGIALVIGGRNGQRASQLAFTLPSASARAIDINAPDFSDVLARNQIGLVIHTAGPFQEQGYTVASACARAGVHYIDLADGRRFVCDFPRDMHQSFFAAGKVAISGASTVPALSSAVVNYLCEGWALIESIDICIAPAQTAPRGLATLRGVLDYCGKDIAVWRGGQWDTAVGWAAPEKVYFQRLRPRIGAVCDIPDLEIFPAYFQVRDRVEFRAAVEVGITQRAFAVIAKLRKMGLVNKPAEWAGLLLRAAPLFDLLGSALGGMVVRVTGRDARGNTVRRSWHIAADHDHGPEIPCMAAILLARQIASGQPMPPGAVTCTGLLKLEQFAPEFSRWGMQTDVVDEA